MLLKLGFYYICPIDGHNLDYLLYDPAISPDNAQFLYHSMLNEGCLGDCIHPPKNGMFPCVARLDEGRIVAEVRSLLSVMEGDNR